MEKQNFNELINKAKSNNQQKTFQKVIPVVQKGIEETQFSFYIEKNLLKKLKQKALDRDESIKSIITIAIEKYLETN